MRITHVSNSFLIVEGGGTKLVCDPWVGISNYGTWHSIPIFDAADVAQAAGDADFVYISHLHADHLDPKTLALCHLETARFVIIKRENSILRRRLEALGAAEVIECEPFTAVDLGGLTVAIVPQMTQTSADDDSDVEFDLDSSIIVTDGSTVYFNQVDNPIAPEDAKVIGDWARANFGEVTMATMTCGAASEYPQCFMNIDRVAAKTEVDDRSLQRLIERLDGIKPRYLSLGGGSYFIPGRNAPLNRYIAVPPFEAVEPVVKNHRPEIKMLALEGGYTADFDGSGAAPDISMTVPAIHTAVSDAVTAVGNIAYGQDNIDPAVADANIDALFPHARQSFIDRCRQRDIQICADISFALHERMMLTNEGTFSSTPDRTIRLDIEPRYRGHELVVHMDKSMFYLLLSGQMVWNLVVSGSQLMYERKPNVFHPTDTFALNFLVHRPAGEKPLPPYPASN